MKIMMLLCVSTIVAACTAGTPTSEPEPSDSIDERVQADVSQDAVAADLALANPPCRPASDCAGLPIGPVLSFKCGQPFCSHTSCNPRVPEITALVQTAQQYQAYENNCIKYFGTLIRQTVSCTCLDE